MDTGMSNGIGDFGALGGLLFGSNDYSNPASAGNPYLSQIGSSVQPLYQPWMNAGQQALPQLQQQYSQLLNNPGGVANMIGSSYHQSPGFGFQVNQATNAANRVAGAGGMLGSPQEQQNIAGSVNGLANQDYYQYQNQAQNLYGQGLQGTQGIMNNGMNQSNNYAQALMAQLMSQANMAYAGQGSMNQLNQQQNGAMSGLFGSGLSSLMGAL